MPIIFCEIRLHQSKDLREKRLPSYVTGSIFLAKKKQVCYSTNQEGLYRLSTHKIHDLCSGCAE